MTQVERIARVCHEANRAFCESVGDNTQKPWDDAEEWQRLSAMRGVEFALKNPDAPASAQHEAWLADKFNDGWQYGPVKNAATKEHPCCVPYAKLPDFQKVKDHLFRGIVHAFLVPLE